MFTGHLDVSMAGMHGVIGGEASQDNKMGVALGKVWLLQLIDSARLWLGLSSSGTSKVASVAPAGN